MGIGNQALNLTFSLYTDGWFKDFKSVIELGSQDIHTDVNDVACVLGALTGNKSIGRDSIKSPRDVYLALGFETYECIDADGRHNALVFDLNESIFAKGFKKQYDLVTNHGTTEHCFDQFHAFQNVHALCTKGGIMIHGLPFQGYLNHGFYNYQPSFFKNLASANNYKIAGIYVNIESSCGDISTYSDELMKFLSITPISTMLLFVVLQKTDENEFRTPFDGQYLESSQVKGSYDFQKSPRMFLPINMTKTVEQYVPSKTLAKILVERVRRKFFK